MVPISGEAPKDADYKSYFGMIGCANGYELPAIKDMVDAIVGRGNSRIAGHAAVRRSVIDESGYESPNGHEPMYDIVFNAYEPEGRIASVIQEIMKIEGVEKVVKWRMVNDNYKWESPQKGKGAD